MIYEVFWWVCIILGYIVSASMVLTVFGMLYPDTLSPLYGEIILSFSVVFLVMAGFAWHLMD